MRPRHRALLLLLLAVPGCLGAGPAAAEDPPAQTRPDRVVVVGVPGLRWSDVTAQQTPTLHQLAHGDTAVGSLSVKARPPVSCAADGFLTLGAGTRAEAFGVPCGRAPTPAQLPELARRNAETREAAVLALLGSALPPDDCVSSNGPLSGSAVGRRGPAAPEGVGGGCALTVLELPAVAGEERAPSRAGTARDVDSALAALLPELSPRTALLVVGVSEAELADGPHLHVALARGPGFSRGSLRSASTRRDGYVQLIDVAPTALSLLGVPVPEGVTGQPWRVAGAAPSLVDLVDADRKATVEAEVRVPFFVAYLGALLALIALLWRRRAAARAVALTGTAVPVASYAANLLPWWRTDVPLLALLALSVGAATVLGLAASRLRGRLAGVGVVLLVSTALILADLLAGAPLQLSSVAGYSPLVAGRFAGIGNVAFGVLAACAVLGAAATRSAPVAVLVGGFVAVVDGAPPFGSDVGGVLALVPAFAVLVLRLLGRRVSVARVVLAGAAGVGLVAAFALVDRARPPDERTHLGRFAQQVVDGSAGTVLRRKAEAVFALLFHSPVTALLPLVVAAVVLLVVRPPAPLREALEDAPAWRSGLAALGVACGIGFALNDSGAAVPALALVVAVPATVAVVLGSGAPQRLLSPGDR